MLRGDKSVKKKAEKPLCHSWGSPRGGFVIYFCCAYTRAVKMYDKLYTQLNYISSLRVSSCRCATLWLTQRRIVKSILLSIAIRYIINRAILLHCISHFHPLAATSITCCVCRYKVNAVGLWLIVKVFIIYLRATDKAVICAYFQEWSLSAFCQSRLHELS